MLLDMPVGPAGHRSMTSAAVETLFPEMEVTMTGKKRTLEQDRLKDRSDIGEVEFPIEKLMKFRDAEASCVHIEAKLQADRGLTDTGKKRPK